MTWTNHARCRGLDPALFFPERGDHEAVTFAKAICAECPVAQQCRDHAIAIEEDDGVWGGTSGLQRRRERRAQLVRDRLMVCQECGATFLGTYRSKLCSKECRQVRIRLTRAKKDAS